MSIQRDLFYGKITKKSKKKGGLKRNYYTATQYTSERFNPGEVEIRFDNKTVTSYGGGNLIKSFLKKINFRKSFSEYVRIPKRSNGYKILDLAELLVDMKVLGLERLMHIESVRQDPYLTKSYRMAKLPPGKTIGGYLKSYEDKNIKQIEYLNTHINRRFSKKLPKGIRKRGVILDYDSSVFTVYGKQEQATKAYSFRKKDNKAFQPKFAFIGDTGILINQKLYSGKFGLSSGFKEFHESTLKKLPKGTKVKAIRGDGALYSEKNIESFELSGYLYGISAALSGKLPGAIHDIPETKWEEGKNERKRIYSIAKITYKPTKWKKARTYIISRRLKEDAKKQGYLFEGCRYKYWAYVTNKKGKLKDIFKFCIERCSLESCIKEAKLGFKENALPCKEFNANRAYLFHVQLAYNLLIYFKLLCFPVGVNRWTIDTIRRRLLLIPGNFRRLKNKWIIHLPRSWRFQEIFKHIGGMLQILEFT